MTWNKCGHRQLHNVAAALRTEHVNVEAVTIPDLLAAQIFLVLQDMSCFNQVDQTYVNNLYFDGRETILQIIDCCRSILRLTGHIHLFNEGTRDWPSTAVHTVVTPGQYEVCAEYGHVHHFQVDLRNNE